MWRRRRCGLGLELCGCDSEGAVESGAGWNRGNQGSRGCRGPPRSLVRPRRPLPSIRRHRPPGKRRVPFAPTKPGFSSPFGRRVRLASWRDRTASRERCRSSCPRKCSNRIRGIRTGSRRSSDCCGSWNRFVSVGSATASRAGSPAASAIPSDHGATPADRVRLRPRRARQGALVAIVTARRCPAGRPDCASPLGVRLRCVPRFGRVRRRRRHPRRSAPLPAVPRAGRAAERRRRRPGAPARRPAGALERPTNPRRRA